ncbi:MAG: TonB-dependent siderophore receptor [Acetobacter sp.]|uniref:TonB-dependent siderophore receptor n=1 Tax=Acetobacter sp. TaxID=440 RepID=UPI0039EACC66
MIADWNEMKRRKATRRLTAFLAASTLMTALATIAHADPVASKPFHIPAQSLPSALALFGRQAGLQVSIPAALVEGKISHAVDGTMAPAQSLAQILSGTGLTYRINGSVVTLVKASSAIMLGPVRVGGTAGRQDPTGPGLGYVAENTMAGTKTDTPITEIPNSIYVITKQLMLDQQAQTVQEALRYMPGIYAEQLGTYSQGAAWSSSGGIKQRGFSSAQFVDGLMSQSFSAGETAFLERVEAVNGPASVMYGQTTPGGMLAMDLKKPTETPLHNASLGFGNWNRYEATFDYSDKITKSGSLRYRIAAIGVTQDTQADHIAYKRVGVLPSITWDIDKKTSLTLLGSYLYTPAMGSNYQEFPVEGTLYSGPYGRIPRSRFIGNSDFNTDSARDAMFEYQFHHRFNRFVEFDQTFRWEESKDREQSLLSIGMQTNRIARLYSYDFRRKNTTIGMDARVHGKFDIGPVNNTWVVGSDFRQYKSNTSTLYDDTPGYNGYPGDNSIILVDIFSPHNEYVPCQDIKNNSCNVEKTYYFNNQFQEGVYFQDQIKWKGLSILIGGRQDWVVYTGRYVSYNNENTNHAISSRSGTYSTYPGAQQKFTWRAGLIYNFDFGLSPYFSYSTSFIPQTGTDYQGKAFAPLMGSQKEVGIKYKVPGRDILITGAAYDINENHYLVTDTQHPNSSADAGRVNAKGFEISANANVTRDIRLVASYSYNSITYAGTNLTSQTELPDGSYGPSASEKGNYVEGVPRNMFSIFADYRLPNRILPGFSINGGVRFIGFTYNDAVNTFKVPAYHLFDIGMHYDLGQMSPALGGLQAQLAVSNLTNKYYVTSCAGNSECFIGQGRRVYGNLSYNW